MKQSIFSAIIAASLLIGCASAYKSSQTPDDLYYSPAKEIVVKENADNKPQQEYQDYVGSNDNRYLRMKVHNYDYWNSIDDYSYWNDSRFGYYNSFYNPYNSFYSPYNYFYNPNSFGFYNSYSFGLGMNYGFVYNPFYFGWNPFYNSYFPNYYGGYGSSWYSPFYVVNNYKDQRINSTSGSNISAYQNKNYNNRNSSGVYFRPGNTANTSTNNLGTLVRKVFVSPNNNNSNNNSWSNPVRVQSSSTSSNSAAGGNSGGYRSSGSNSSSGRGPRK